MQYKGAYIERWGTGLIAYVDDGDDFYQVDAIERFGIEVEQEFLAYEENERIGFYLYRRYKTQGISSIADYWF